jgi:hypothetical protein
VSLWGLNFGYEAFPAAWPPRGLRFACYRARGRFSFVSSPRAPRGGFFLNLRCCTAIFCCVSTCVTDTVLPPANPPSSGSMCFAAVNCPCGHLSWDFTLQCKHRRPLFSLCLPTTLIFTALLCFVQRKLILWPGLHTTPPCCADIVVQKCPLRCIHYSVFGQTPAETENDNKKYILTEPPKCISFKSQ